MRDVLPQVSNFLGPRMESSGRLNVPAGHQLTFTAPESRSVFLSLLLAEWQELLIVQI